MKRIKFPFLLIGDTRELRLQDPKARAALVKILVLLGDETLAPLGKKIRAEALEGLK